MCKEHIGIPESEWTKGQREFVGTTFPTLKGGVLTVIGVAGKDKYCKAIFSLECSICSEDEELWPLGSISSTKINLVKRQIPCGCSKYPLWTEGQYKVRVGRECNSRCYTFHGWEGVFNGNKTKLDLGSSITGNRWKSTNINQLFNGQGDPVEGRENTRQSQLIPDNQHIQDFIKAGFDSEYTFYKGDGKNSWRYMCPVCSKDPYVTVGACSGVFESDISSLKVGKKACRCSKTYRWTQEQREYQINKVCKEEGLIFIEWSEGGYNNSHSKFKWICSEQHECETRTYSFLQGIRCPTCANYGFDPSRSANLYLVEWFGYGKSYLKKGITNNSTLARVKGQSSKSKLDYRIIREIYCEDGEVLQDYESFLNKHFEGSACPKKWMQDGYTETVHNTPENFKLLMEFFDKFEDELVKSDKQK